jgi:hypothetical protein
MKQEACESGRCYVFGAGASDVDLAYIGHCDKPPEEIRLQIFQAFIESGNEPLRQWAAQALDSRKASVFEIQACTSAAEASQEVGFWTQYFLSLGVRLFEPHRAG